MMEATRKVRGRPVRTTVDLTLTLEVDVRGEVGATGELDEIAGVTLRLGGHYLNAALVSEAEYAKAVDALRKVIARGR